MMALIFVTLGLILTLVPSTGAAASATWTTGPLLGPVEGAPVRNYGIVEQGVLSRSGKRIHGHLALPAGTHEALSSE